MPYSQTPPAQPQFAGPPAGPPVRTGGKPTANAPRTATVPDFVGTDLQAAQDMAREAGSHGLASHDAPGRERMQAFDRNGKVCAREPSTGASPDGQPVTLEAVRFEESRP